VDDFAVTVNKLGVKKVEYGTSRPGSRGYKKLLYLEKKVLYI